MVCNRSCLFVLPIRSPESLEGVEGCERFFGSGPIRYGIRLATTLRDYLQNVAGGVKNNKTTWVREWDWSGPVHAFGFDEDPASDQSALSGARWPLRARRWANTNNCDDEGQSQS
jgi:hypothetical protein